MQYMIVVLVVLVVQYVSNAFVINYIENNVENILLSTIENDVKVIENNISRIKEKTLNVGTNLYPSLSRVEPEAASFISDNVMICIISIIKR